MIAAKHKHSTNPVLNTGSETGWITESPGLNNPMQSHTHTKHTHSSTLQDYFSLCYDVSDASSIINISAKTSDKTKG